MPSRFFLRHMASAARARREKDICRLFSTTCLPISWGEVKPQSARIPRTDPGSPDPAANPYLAFAVLLAAGLKGIEEGYELPEGADDDVWELTDAERKALGIEPLPTSLEAAIAVMERSELVAETLGEHVFDYFLRNKRQEWAEYRAQVTPYELQRFLPLV